MKGIVVTIEIGVGQGKELLQGIMVITKIEAQATNRDRIRCYASREYHHFARDGPNSKRRERFVTVTAYVKYGTARS